MKRKRDETADVHPASDSHAADNSTTSTTDHDQELTNLLGPSKKATEAEAARFLQFYDSLSPDQQRRYEAYRRSRLHPADVKQLMSAEMGASRKITEPASIVVAGLTKLFVGDIVERARVIMEMRKDTGPICPQHLREAYRQLQQASQLPLIRSVTSSLRR